MSSGTILRNREQIIIDGLFGREITLEKKGEVHDGHKHRMGHAMVLMRGAVSVRFWYDGEPPPGRKQSGKIERIDAPMIVPVLAEVCHEITALEDNTAWICLFAVPELLGMRDETLLDEAEPLEVAMRATKNIPARV